MDGPRHERRHHFRGKARPGRVLPVRIRRGPTDPWIPAETRNIGVGGAFVATELALEQGAPITVELTLPGAARAYALPCVVRWRRAVGDRDDGLGVQFVGVDVDVLLELNDFFASLTPATMER
jgi:hypothetical protein